jgi:hypothetical protein
MKKFFLTLSILLVFAVVTMCASTPGIAGDKDIYIDLTPPGVVYFNGSVVEIAERYIIIEDEDGNRNKLWINEYTSCYPRDYAPYILDHVNVRCYMNSAITKRPWIQEIQFLKENFKPVE